MLVSGSVRISKRSQLDEFRFQQVEHAPDNRVFELYKLLSFYIFLYLRVSSAISFTEIALHQGLLKRCYGFRAVKLVSSTV